MTWFFSQNMITELTNWASHSLFLRGKSESFGSVPKGTTGPTIWKVPKFGRFWKGWGVGRGMGDFRHISGEKIYLARKYLEKKYPALKKELCISARVMAAGIKSHTVVCPEVWEKKNLTQTKSPIPRLRSETGLKSWEFKTQRWYKITPIYNLELGRWLDFSQCDKPVRVPFSVPARLTVGEIHAGKTNWSH